MAWKTVSGTHWTYTGYNYKGDLYLTLQYDDTTVTPTSVSVRFLMSRADEGIKYSDGFGVLLNPVNSDGSMNSSIRFLKLKDATSDNFSSWQWPEDDYATSRFEINKSYSAEKFSLPAFWFVNTWAQKTAVQSAALSGDASRVFFYAQDATGANSMGAARRYKTTFAASSWAIAAGESVVEPLSGGELSISNPGNNTFTITGKAAAGKNNPVKSFVITYGYDTEANNGTYEISSGTTKMLPSTSGASRSVYAKAITTPTYGSAITIKKSAKIYHYIAPSVSTAPYISNLKTDFNNRLTIKKPWTFTWAGAAGNDSSPVKGYRIALLKNGTSIPIYNSSGTLISSNPTEPSWHSFDTASTTLTIDPDKCGFSPKDTVQLGVKPYTHYGNGNTLFNDSYTYSTSITVQNAGIVRVKTATGWKEGQVYVKTSTGWKEAETVNVKTSSGWKESQ